MKKKESVHRQGRPGITLEDVERAVAALRLQGRRIGQSNVRLELGRGSRTTITAHLRTLGLSAPRVYKKEISGTKC
jgi:hypothetical protein